MVILPEMEFERMVTLGESTTAGAGASLEEKRWANLLAAKLSQFQSKPVELINKGIGSNVISPESPSYEASAKPSALERVQSDVMDQKPDLVTIQYGLNDNRAGMPVQLFTQKLEELIDAIRAGTQAEIVLATVAHMTRYDMPPNWDKGNDETCRLFNSAIKQVGTRNRLPVADVYTAFNRCDILVHPDGVHPSDLGHQVIADCFFQAIATGP